MADTHRLNTGFALDPVTFEVLKNSFITAVDQMAEQMIRTCYSFVIYNRDFSNALNDHDGDSIAQGRSDIAVHVGTLHWTCKDVIRFFGGDMHPGDVFAINDPYAGGTQQRGRAGWPRTRSRSPPGSGPGRSMSWMPCGAAGCC